MKTLLPPPGRRPACRVHGDGEPVLLLPGIAASGDAWSPLVERLAARHRCVIYDAPDEAAPTVAGMVGDALLALDTAGVAKAHVVGHSLGGLVALELALRARERVAGLSLVCVPARGAAAGRSPRVLKVGLLTQIGTPRMRRRAFLELLVSPQLFASGDLDAWATRIGALLGFDLVALPDGVLHRIGALCGHDVWPRLHELAGLPTLVVGAEHDLVVPSYLCRGLAATLPGARFVEIAGAAHGVVLEQPDDVVALLQQHLASR